MTGQGGREGARIVLGVAGGIAAYKATALVRALREEGHVVDVVPTEAALRFVGAPTWEALSARPVHTSVFEAVDAVNHVALGQHADLVLVAPATADLLSRAATGRADDLLTATLLATAAPVVMAPAMHTEMWEHPATVANVATLRSRGVTVIDPAVGRLTGPDSGPGRLPEPEDILAVALRVLDEHRSARQQPGAAQASADHGDAAAAPDAAASGGASARPLTGLRAVVSAGGTREPLDPVRFLGNRSSGKQGIALAEALRDAGATVELVLAHVEVPAPVGVHVHHVSTAAELAETIGALAPQAELLIMAAAVADFRPAEYVDAKIKKSDDGGAPTLQLVRNPDILADAVAARRQAGPGAAPRLIVGFAAETGDAEHSVLEHGRAKLERKGCEVLVVNEVGTDRGFGRDENAVTVLFADGTEPLQAAGSKSEISATLVTALVPRLRP